LVIFILFLEKGYSQSLLDDALQHCEQQDWIPAKEAIDQYVNGEGTADALGWLLKSRIYAGIGSDNRYRSLVADPEMEAFDAIVQAVALDRQKILPKLQQEATLITRLYQSLTSRGISIYNGGMARAQVSVFGTAVEEFRKALRISTFMAANGIGKHPALDTGLIYMAAQASVMAGQEDNAILYAKTLADAGIFATKKHSGADFKNLYAVLIQYFTEKRDVANTEKYVGRAIKGYPRDIRFHQTLTTNLRTQAKYGLLLEAQETAVQFFPGHDSLTWSYCKDLYQAFLQTDHTIRKRAQQNIERVLPKYIQNNPSEHPARLLMARYYYNKAVAQQQMGIDPKAIHQSLVSSNKLLATLKDIITSLSPEDQENFRIVQDRIAGATGLLR
jgi:tetratricopeptide (TPR) repeat protein